MCKWEGLDWTSERWEKDVTLSLNCPWKQLRSVSEFEPLYNHIFSQDSRLSVQNSHKLRTTHNIWFSSGPDDHVTVLPNYWKITRCWVSGSNLNFNYFHLSWVENRILLVVYFFSPLESMFCSIIHITLSDEFYSINAQTYRWSSLFNMRDARMNESLFLESTTVS